MKIQFDRFASLLMVFNWHLVAKKTLSVLGMLRQDNQMPYFKVIYVLPTNYASLPPDSSILASCSCDNSICLWDVKRVQDEPQFDCHVGNINKVRFSPDGTVLASGSFDHSIRLWDFMTRKEIQTYDKDYKDILEQFQTTLLQSSQLPEATHITILYISQQLTFQAQGAQILKGEFINQLSIDLLKLFKQRGSSILKI